MDVIKLTKIINRQEGANLEFKRQWYDLENSNPKIAESARGEMIKDILSLANGNTSVAGETSFLIIGVSDETNEHGHRDLFDVITQKPISRQRLLDYYQKSP